MDCNGRLASIRIHAMNPGTSSVHITHDIAHMVFRNNHYNLHNGFIKHRTSIFESNLKSTAASNFKSDWFGIHGVFFAVDDRDTHIMDWVTCHNAFFQNVANTLFNWAHVVAGNGAAKDIVTK